jgi:uncharacterized protein YjbI with pentapeptide repeats
MIGISLVFVYLLSKETFLWLIGKRTEYKKIIMSSHALSVSIANAAVDTLPMGLNKEEKERIKNDIPTLLDLHFMGRINTYISKVFIGAFSIAFGFLSTIVLLEQNKKIEIQNQRLNQQLYLQEAERRSSLVFLFSNIMDAINNELKEDYAKDNIRNLSPQLIGRIISLSHRLEPYQYLDADTLIGMPLSPERGQLLINLVESQLDTLSYKKIWLKTDFSYSDLKGILFEDTVYLVGINLERSNLTEATLKGARLNHANLSNALMTNINLERSNISHGNLANALLTEANLANSNLTNINLNSIYANSINLNNTILKNGTLNRANIRNSLITNSNLNNIEMNNATIIGCLFSNSVITNSEITDTKLLGLGARNTSFMNTDLQNTKLLFSETNKTNCNYSGSI